MAQLPHSTLPPHPSVMVPQSAPAAAHNTAALAGEHEGSHFKLFGLQRRPPEQLPQSVRLVKGPQPSHFMPHSTPCSAQVGAEQATQRLVLRSHSSPLGQVPHEMMRPQLFRSVPH